MASCMCRSRATNSSPESMRCSPKFPRCCGEAAGWPLLCSAITQNPVASVDGKPSWPFPHCAFSDLFHLPCSCQSQNFAWCHPERNPVPSLFSQYKTCCSLKTHKALFAKREFKKASHSTHVMMSHKGGLLQLKK